MNVLSGNKSPSRRQNMVCLNKADICRGDLIMVNASYPLKREIDPTALTSLCRGEEKMRMQPQAVIALTALLRDIRNNGRIVPVSAFRPMQEQIQIYKEALRDYGPEFTNKYVALPGCSEHQTGLAIDLGKNGDWKHARGSTLMRAQVIKSLQDLVTIDACAGHQFPVGIGDNKSIDFIRPEFSYTGICGEFRREAAAYGFIERYGRYKQEVTNIAWEPWHFRYVGPLHAKIMEVNQLALEEYIAWLYLFPYGKRVLTFNCKGRSYEVAYVKAEEGETTIDIPAKMHYSISGNNVDGFIITLWN